MRRLLHWTGGAFATLLLATAGTVAWLAWGSLPQVEGRIAVRGASEPVELVRDRWGIPHIRAQSIADAYFGLGFAHAQDRLWQMELRRRVAQGRLAEVVGAAAVPFDRLTRTLGIYRRARESVAALPDDARRNLEAYAAGVNAVLDLRFRPLPPEFQLLWDRPEPWTLADSLSFTRLMSLDLGYNWRQEVLRARLAKVVTPAQLADLFPGPLADSPITLGRLQDAMGELDLDRLAAALPPGPPPGQGSNIWAVAGARTRSGAPLLANDPHLGFEAPGVWYLAGLEAPGLAIVGGTMPAMPIVVAGRNHALAWGLTNTGPDTQDLFVERLDPADPARYLTPGGSEPLVTRDEQILVRGAPPVRLVVRETRHGPIVSDLMADGGTLGGDGTVLALAWTALDPGDVTLVAGFDLARAQTPRDVDEAVRPFASPQQNLVWATRQGSIGLVAPGNVPIRRAGDGLMPVPGWDGRHDWTGRIPFAALPRRADPASGQIVNANNRVVGPDYPYLLTAEWEPDLRARRIEALLGTRGGLTAQDFAAMQVDVRSGLADEFLPRLLQAPGLAADLPDLVQALAAWDRRMVPDRPEPLAFAAWYRALAEEIYADELGPTLFAAYRLDRPDFVRRVLADRPQWCDVVGTPAVETCDERIASAWHAASRALLARYGTDWRAWRWGEANRIVMRHEPLQHVPVLGRLFEIDVPGRGDGSTVDVGHYRSDDGVAFDTVSGPSLRMIVDLGDPDASLFVTPTGQSGHPLSAHWSDLTELWASGGYVPMQWGTQLPDGQTLTLEPVEPQPSVNR